MLGAIAGDIIGSVYEHHPIKTMEFPLFHPRSRFTDDTVMTLAVAQAILLKQEYGLVMKSFGRIYPRAGYGGNFYKWIFEEKVEPYGSWGNGSAMRVSPIGFAFNTEQDVLREAENSARVSHDHIEGIKGAQGVALAIFLARQGVSKSEIRTRISKDFSYDLNRTVDIIRPSYRFDVSCQGSVPEAIIAFLDSINYEDAVRKAISLGGDSDTLACIAGGIAQAFYREIPEDIINGVKQFLPGNLWLIVEEFQKHYPVEF